jgi:hypothetical protein
MKKRANMEFFNAQTNNEEAKRHTMRSLRRRNNDDEAVALELEEVRPTACDRHRRWRGTCRDG